MQSGGRSCGDHAGNAIQGCRLAANRRITVDCVGIWQPVPYGKSSGTVHFLLCSCGFESLFQCQSQRLSSCFSNWGILGRFVPKVWARVPGEFWKVPAVLGEVQESILGRVLWGSGQRFCIPKGSGENSGFLRFWQKVLLQRSGKKMRNEFGFQHTGYIDMLQGVLVCEDDFCILRCGTSCAPGFGFAI